MEGSAICWDREAITKPASLRITTLILARFALLKNRDHQNYPWTVMYLGVTMMFLVSLRMKVQEYGAKKILAAFPLFVLEFVWMYLLFHPVKGCSAISIKVGYLSSMRMHPIILTKLELCLKLLWFQSGTRFQNFASFRQRYRAWATSSWWDWWILQVPSIITCLFTRFIFESRELQHALQLSFWPYLECLASKWLAKNGGNYTLPP